MGGRERLQAVSLWRELPAAHRRWIVVKALAATAVVNTIVNAAIAWASVQGQAAVTLWGLPLVETSIFWNVVGTLFLLPMITCLLVTTAVRRDVRVGSLAPLSRLHRAYRWLAVMPSAALKRGVVFGVVAVAVLAPPLLLAIVVSGFPDLTRGEFVASQTAFAVALGAIVTPVIALYAMAEPPADR